MQIPFQSLVHLRAPTAAYVLATIPVPVHTAFQGAIARKRHVQRSARMAASALCQTTVANARQGSTESCVKSGECHFESDCYFSKNSVLNSTFLTGYVCDT